MSLATKFVTVELTEINCGCCGGTYAINERYHEKQEQVGGSWNCPYCKVSWGFANNNENARLRKQLKQAQKSKEWAQQDARHEREQKEEWKRKEQGQRSAKTRIKNRVAKGVCPCCNRTFMNLQKHMAGQHPDYADPT